MRNAINSGEVNYFDMHLSMLAQQLRYGYFGKINVAIIEACDVTEEGEIIPTTGVGISPTIAQLADLVIVELNSFHPKELKGIHDLAQLDNPPHRMDIGIQKVQDRVGVPYLKVDPSKIIVVKTHAENEGGAFAPVDETTAKLAKT